MERILLYYPAINIPNGDWLRNSILYTDKVASIYPFEEIDDRHVSKDMRILFDEGQYEPIKVTKELQEDFNELNKFFGNFMNAIDSKEFKSIQQNRKDIESSIKVGYEDYFIYSEKFTEEVIRALSDRGLLNRMERGIFSVERNTGIIYMSMLADYLARVNKNLVIPSTDDDEVERLAFRLADNKIVTHKIQLDKCLPTPSPNTSLKDIVKFKNSRKQELLKFRVEMDNLEKEIKAMVNDDERKIKMLQFQEKIQIEIKEIKKVMGDSRLEYIFNSFSSLLDFKQPEVVGTISTLGVAGGIISNLPMVGLVAGAILLVGTLVSSFMKLNRKVEANSFSYIYYGQKESILPKKL